MAEPKQYGIRAHWRCIFACTLVSMSPFQYGVDFGLIGGMQAMIGFLRVFGYIDPTNPIGYNISTGVQQLISSLMTLGAFVGSLAAGPMAVYLGRKSCLWIACILCGASTAVMLGTTHLAGLYIGRLFIGFANGFFMTFSQLYLQEVSPAKYRGLALSAFVVWVSVGTLIGTIVDNFTSKILGRASYMIPLALIYIVPTILGLGLFLIPESPRWLLMHDKSEKARKSLDWLRPDKTALEAELLEMQAAIDSEKQNAAGAAILDMWRNPIDRRRTLLAIGAVMCQAGCGAMYIIGKLPLSPNTHHLFSSNTPAAYGTYFFSIADVGKPFENSCILVAVGVVAILIDCVVITKYGRRRVWLTTGLIVCGFCQLIIAVVYTKNPTASATGKITVAFSTIYTFVYNGAIGPFSWVSAGELPSQRLRSYTFGIAAAAGFLGAWLCTFTAPYFINPSSLNWGPKYGYIWFPSCLLCAAFVYFYLPEVKGRTLEEIDEMFEARLPARQFRGYKCSRAEAIRHKAGVLELDAIMSLEKPLLDATVEAIGHVQHKV